MIGFGLTLVIRNIDAGVSWPWRFIDSVAATGLASRAEVEVTDMAEITKPDASGIAPHVLYHFCYRIYIVIVPLLILMSRGVKKDEGQRLRIAAQPAAQPHRSTRRAGESGAHTLSSGRLSHGRNLTKCEILS